ncbi:MAG TPA: sodium:calcium antiporter [Actinomycetota bacterium]|nr:sodium:calcium antiporter [Actinomycetota bacterium]
MRVLDLRGLPLWLQFAVFVLAAAVVWIAAVRASRYAGAISRKTRLGQGFVGMVLLAVATSLPELGATATASVTGNAPLAANNLLGGVAFQTTVLAIADAASRRRLTAEARGPSPLMQGAALVLVLSLVLAGISVGGGPALAGASVWTIALAVAYLVSAVIVRRETASRLPAAGDTPGPRPEGSLSERSGEVSRYGDTAISALAFRFGVAATIILLAGSALARTAEAIADGTGLGAGFVGATLLALATSLPEVGSTVEAARQGLETMAIGNVLGSNAMDVFLLFVADMLFSGGPILGRIGAGSAFLAAVAISLTAVYLFGLLLRRTGTVGRVGVDSIVVAALYVTTVVVLYVIR